MPCARVVALVACSALAGIPCAGAVEDYHLPSALGHRRRLQECDISDANKVNCGFLGILEDQCQEAGCCYRKSEASGTPWCFYTAVPDDKCEPKPGQTSDCGFDGDIVEDTCKNQGCCYAPAGPQGAAICFKKPGASSESVTHLTPTTAPPASQSSNSKCIVSDKKKIDCAWHGVTPSTCEDMGCCYYYVDILDTPACFYKLHGAPANAVAKHQACTILDHQRIDCGNEGIQPHECVDKGCCYRHAETPGVPYCYYTLKDAPSDKEAEAEQCTVHEHEKLDCGFEGEAPESCRAQGCCYVHSSIPGIPFCYYRKGKEPPGAAEEREQCKVPDPFRGDCGFLGVTKAKCREKGCCYQHPAVPEDGAPYCYFRSTDPRQHHGAVSLHTSTVGPECSVPGSDRMDCGVAGITPAECTSKGCCYYHTATIGAPFCFYKADTSSTKLRTSSTRSSSLAASATTSLQPSSSSTAGMSAPLPQDAVLGSGRAGSKRNLETAPGGTFAVASLTAVAATAVLCLAYVICFRPKFHEVDNMNADNSQTPLYDRVPSHNRCQLALPDSEVYQEYHRLFMQKWNPAQWPTAGGRDVPPPRISAIYEIDAETHLGLYKTKQRDLDRAPGPKHGSFPGNEKNRFHGTRMRCCFEGVPCRDATCSVCRIVEQGHFGNDIVIGEMRFTASSHAAKGQGLAPGKDPPPRNLQHFVDADAGNAMFVAGVLMGTPQIVTSRTEGQLPPGTHSRIADQDATGVDEIVIFDEAQAVPKALIVFST